MANIKTKNIFPLTDLQRSPGKLVSKAIETGEPVVVTQYGRPAVVILDCGVFEKLEEGSKDAGEFAPQVGSRERILRDELQRIVAQIAAQYDPERIVLFGSLATGRVSESSDIDIIVVKETEKKFWERQKELARLVRPRIACDMLVYTPKEWEDETLAENDFFNNEIRNKGKIVYERAA